MKMKFHIKKNKKRYKNISETILLMITSKNCHKKISKEKKMSNRKKCEFVRELFFLVCHRKVMFVN